MTYLDELHSAHVARRARLSAPLPGANPRRPLRPVAVEIEIKQPEPQPVPIIRMPVASSGAITASRVVREVAAEFGMAPGDLSERKRTRHFIIPRHIAMYLARRLTALSLPLIGRRMGGFDHATVLNGIRKGERLAASVEHGAKVEAILSRLVRT